MAGGGGSPAFQWAFRVVSAEIIGKELQDEHDKLKNQTRS